MKLRQLRYFVAVAEELHFSRAAERLHVSQPALSRQIRDLEAEIDTVLIDRRGRDVRLSTAGKVFFEQAKAALQSIEEACQAARDAGRGNADRLRIGLVEGLTGRDLGKLLRAFHDIHPTIEFDLQSMPAADQRCALAAGELDLGLASHSADTVSLAIEPLWSEPLLIALPDDHALAGQKTIGLSDLAGMPLVTPLIETHPDLRRSIGELLEESAIQLSPIKEVSNIDLMLILVATGVGFAIIPEATGSAVPAGVGLHRIRSSGAAIEISAIYRRDETSPAVLWLVDMAKQVMKPGQHASSPLVRRDLRLV